MWLSPVFVTRLCHDQRGPDMSQGETVLSPGEAEPRCKPIYSMQLPARSRVAPFPVQTGTISLHDSTSRKHKTLTTIGRSFSRIVSAWPYLPCHCQRQLD